MCDDNSTKLQIVQDYCAKEWKVFPIHSVVDGKCTCGADPCRDVGKHPITTSGVKNATNDPETLERYFGGEYAIANVGLATGEPSGVWVLDIDGGEGLKTLREWEGRYGSLPQTVTAQTGAGEDHQHLLFQFDERCVNKKNAVKFANGIDVRFTGGYVILPPSKHKSGNQYKWLLSPNDTPLATAPDWLLALIPDRDSESPKADPKIVPTPEPVKAEPASKLFKIERAKTLQDRCTLYLEQTPPAISGGAGHDTTFNVCCRLIELFGELSDDEFGLPHDSWARERESILSCEEIEACL